MFQYTKEIVLNNPEFVEDAPASKIVIKRAGEYIKDYILPAKIYKTPGYKGSKGTLSIDFNNLFGQENYPVTAQLQFRVVTPNQFHAEFANPVWKPFGTPVMVGFEVTEELANNSEKLASRVAELINLTMASDNKFMTVKTEGSKVVIEGKDEYMKFDKVSLEKYDMTACESCIGYYAPITIPEGQLVMEDNKEPFATGKWIQENLRFPTYANIRYESPNADEEPILNEVYTQYSFSYQSPRPGLGGASGVGQEMVAVTRHIFYVPSSKVADFEAGFEGIEFDSATDETVAPGA